MKLNRRHGIAACAVVFVFLFSIVACLKQKFPDMGMEDKMIDYPAAYVVNGETGTLSVIRLSDNSVSETIELMGGDNKMTMWFIGMSEQRLITVLF